MLWLTILLLPLFILPFFDQTLQELPFVYFLAAEFLLLPVVFVHLKNVAFRPNKIVSWLFWGLIIQILISVIFSYSISVPHSTAGLMVFISAYVWYLLGSSTTPEMKKVLPLMIISASIILSLISYLISLKILPAPAGSVNLLTWTFGHHRLAGYLLFSLPLTIWAISQDWKWKKPAIIALAVILPAFIASGGRAAYLGALTALIYLQKGRLFAVRQGAFLIISIAVVLLFFLTIPLFYRLWPEAAVFWPLADNQTLSGILIKPLSADSRFSYWAQAVRAVINDPLGYGLETFRFQSLFFRLPGETTSGYVHNQYLQVFSETGIIGGILFLTLVIMALKQSHRTATETGGQLATALTAGLIASATAAFLDFDWQFPSIFLLFWLIAGVASSEQENNQDRSKLPAAALFIISTIYGLTVLVGLKIQPTLINYWDRGGEKVFSGSAVVLSKLHPRLEEEVLETAKKKMPTAEFETFIKWQFPLYQYDNWMLARVLQWQKKFGSKQDTLTTAAVMLDNDPLNKQTQQILQETAASVPNP